MCLLFCPPPYLPAIPICLRDVVVAALKAGDVGRGPVEGFAKGHPVRLKAHDRRNGTVPGTGSGGGGRSGVDIIMTRLLSLLLLPMLLISVVFAEAMRMLSTVLVLDGA